jgi:hypothetical protein
MIRINKLAVIVLLGTMGCDINDSKSAINQVQGCYDPNIGPFLRGEYPGNITPPHWVALDTVPAEHAPVPRAYRVRTSNDVERLTHLEAWWEPLGKDSILVLWATDGPTIEFRLLVEQEGLQGTRYVKLDVLNVEPPPSVHITAKKVAC